MRRQRGHRPIEWARPGGGQGHGVTAASDAGEPGAGADPLPGQHPSPWFRSASVEPEPQPQPQPQPQPYSGDWYAAPEPAQGPPEPTYEQLYGAYAPEPIADDETVGLRTADTRRAIEPEPGRPAEGTAATGSTAATEGAVATGGRAARRKAAKKGGTPVAAPRPGAAPLSRVEARRAERARRPSPGAVISRGLGEVFITVGVLMLLFVTYQLWWTNIRAQQQADGAAHDLQEDWASGKGKPGAFEPGQGFALLHIPKLDVVVPVAEGIDKQQVLDRGMAGHYNEGATKTAMPDAEKGNFAVAGHRNTHGEPFRYINRLEPGDPIVVETRDKYFVYKMASILPQTDPGNTRVLDPVPRGSGFTKPGRYITLTTCTPEFTSKYRMIVWGKMAEERPRSKGKPSALVN
ncbi:class E sortase [Streptomyces sp. WAC 01529]|nr:class E sortase [Streptomyces sp. WAC 01529]